MATKVDQTSAVEPRGAQTTSAASTSSTAKVSMFGKKSGFVIPKNKLSGSLVPVFRGGVKQEGSDAAKEESSKQVQRKTKWGTDLTEDAAVRKGRALAYQTRVEQITQQLKSGIPNIGDAQASQSPSQIPKSESSSDQINDETQKLEQLELEKREAIGEILKLNPSFKAPSDYKPLLKEAVVPIPLKTYPGYNFIGLLVGPGSNTQKRLEEETGAKIRVHGTKAGTGEKDEIIQEDGKEGQGAYAELYVHVSADTYEKVDAAVALIELLVTPVSGNSAVVSSTPTSVSGDSVNVLDQSQKNLVTGYMMPVAAGNQGLVPPMIVSAQPGPPQVQFQPYPGPWFPIRPPSGFAPRPNTSLPMLNNPVQFPPSPLNPSTNPTYFGGLSPAVAGFGSVPRNHPSQPSMPVLQRPYMPEARPPSHVLPRNYSMPGPWPPPAYTTASAQPNLAVSQPFTGNQSTPAGPSPIARQPVPLMPQPVATAPSGPLPNRPLTSAGSSTGWSGVPAVTPAPQGTGNMMQMAPPMVPPQRPHPASVAPPNISPNLLSRPAAPNAVSPARFPSRPSTPQLMNTPNHPPVSLGFASVPPQVGFGIASSASSLTPTPVPVSSAASIRGSGPLLAPSMAVPTQIPPSIFPRFPAPIPPQAAGTTPASASASIHSTSPVAPMQPVSVLAPVSNPSQNSVQGSSVVSPTVPLTSPEPQPGIPTVSGNLPSFTSIKPPVTSPGSIPPVTAPKPQRPSSGDFTFQPLRPQLPASQTVPRSSSQPLAQNTQLMPPKPAMQPRPAPQPPSFRPALHLAPQPGMQSFPRSQAINQMGQPHSPVPPPSPGSVVPFSGNPTAIPPPPPPMLPAFPNPRSNLPRTPTPQMGPRSFGSASHMPNMSGSLPPRPANPLLLQQNQRIPTIRPENLLAPKQQFNNNVTFPSGKPASSPGGNQIYDPFSPTSVTSAPPRQGNSSANVGKQENDPEYEDLMASVGVR